MRISLFLVLMTAAITAPLHGRSYYVSPSGSDAAAGTISAPWRSFARASSGLQAGDTVNVREGTYFERFVPSNGGSPSNPIVYRAYPGEFVSIVGASDNELTVMAIYPSNIVIEGFTIRNQNYFRAPGKQTYWVQLEGSNIIFRRNRVIADGDVFKNIYTLNAASRGIVVAGRNVTVENCYVRGQVIGIIVVGPTPRFVILRNDTVHANGQNNIDIGSTDDGSTGLHGTLIESCILDTSFVEDNIQFEPDYGDPVSTLHNRGTIIRNCVMGNAAENAIDLKGAGHTIIENNIMFSSDGDDDGPLGGHDTNSGAGVETSPVVPTRYTIVRGNVIWDHSTGLTMAEGDHYFNNTILNNRRDWRGPNQTGNGHTNLRAWNYPNVPRAFVNNIVGGMPTAPVFNWLMDWGDKFLLDNNLYFEPSGPVTFEHRVSGNMVVARGLAAWQSILQSYGGYGYLVGKDQRSQEADPQFLNVPDYPTGYDPSWNFGVRETSPAIDGGRPVTVATAAGSGSTTLPVADAYFFCDGFGITEGDLIKIGSTDAVRIASINYNDNVITLAEPRTWSSGQGVNLDYSGGNPDIGAVEFTAGTVQAPGVPALSTPPDGSDNIALSVVLSWSGGVDAASYEVQVATTQFFDAPIIVQSGIAALTYTVRNLAENTTHYWRVRSANGVGVSAWTGARAFTTIRLDSLPPPPSTTLPTDGESGTSTSLQFSWSSVANAVSYRIQIDRTPDFTTPIVDLNDVTATTIEATGLATNTRYYWRVAATSTKGTGPWSLIATLITFTPPTSLEGNAVSNGDFTRGIADWNFFTNGVGTFTVGTPGFRKKTSAKVYITQTGSNVQLYQRNLVMSPDSMYRLSFTAFSTTGNDMEVSVHRGLWPFTDYGLNAEHIQLTTGWNVYVYEFKPQNFSGMVNDVRLRFSFDKYAVAGDVYSLDNVRFQAINALTPPPPETLPVDYSLEANFPNPFNPTTTIRYSIPTNTFVKLEVYNILGQHVLSLVNGFQPVGTYNLSVDLSGYASGVYFYTLQADAFRQTRKLLLVK